MGIPPWIKKDNLRRALSILLVSKAPALTVLDAGDR
jgi:hypothetical protein